MRAVLPARREREGVNQRVPEQPGFNLWLSFNLKKTKEPERFSYSAKFNMLNIGPVWRANSENQEEPG